jgi:hypothetical protein
MLDKALVIVANLYCGFPLVFFVQKFYFVMLYKTLREAEGCIVIPKRAVCLQNYVESTNILWYNHYVKIPCSGT